MMVMKPIEISNSKVLRILKTHTITECWLECQKTVGCETIGTGSGNEKINGCGYDCYILGVGENKVESSSETSSQVNQTSLVTVSYFE